MRVGVGFDVHKFSDDPGRACVLGGVVMAGTRGLDGHSDADVVAHAIADAIAGAAGIGDIGQHFPDDDRAWEGADSLGLLRRIVEEIVSSGWRLVNVDCTVVADRPHISPARYEMVEALSAAARAPVSVKATRPEGLGALGRGEGISCIAVALVEAAETARHPASARAAGRKVDGATR